jgi:hypothetical protein
MIVYLRTATLDKRRVEASIAHSRSLGIWNSKAYLLRLIFAQRGCGIGSDQPNPLVAILAFLLELYWRPKFQYFAKLL